MELKKDLLSKLKRAIEMLREAGPVSTLQHYLMRAGITLIPFYYVRELLPAHMPAVLTTLPDGFEFSVFGPDEVAAISKLAERKGYVPERYVLDNFNQGDLCLGIKHKGAIAAFTWTALDETRAHYYPATMKANEAYLFDMYVLKAFRGKNLAPILRHKNYQILKEMGRDTFYSITLTSNKASLRFKQKLDAQVVLLAVYYELFSKWRGHWVIWEY